MSAFDLTLARWKLSAPVFLAKIAASPELDRWQAAIDGHDGISFRFLGPSYELIINPRVVDLRSDGKFAVQTQLVCDSLLARKLNSELRLASCWTTGSYYRIGTFHVYLEWFAANTADTPQFRPTYWSEGAPEDEIVAWLQNLNCIASLISAVKGGGAVFPVLNDMVNQPKRIPGSPPTWSSSFDHAVASLDVHSASEVALQAERASTFSGVLPEVACELKRLIRWLSNGAPSQ